MDGRYSGVSGGHSGEFRAPGLSGLSDELCQCVVSGGADRLGLLDTPDGGLGIFGGIVDAPSGEEKADIFNL